jgi:hypothetical protein
MGKSMIPQSTTVAAYDADQNIAYRFVVAPDDDKSHSSMSTMTYEPRPPPPPPPPPPSSENARMLTMRIKQETHRMKQKTRQIRSRWMDLPQWHGRDQPGWRQSFRSSDHSDDDSSSAEEMVPKTWDFSYQKNLNHRKPWGAPFQHEQLDLVCDNDSIKRNKNYKQRQLERRRMGSTLAEF